MYLDIGTGYACAWHNNAKVEPWSHLIENVDASVENAGALNPTGSRHERNLNLGTDFNIECWNKRVCCGKFDNIIPKSWYVTKITLT